ncbi:CDP-alcohol phosphatidyltransferase family protein [Chromatocurvus halotolerans]|uniref:CDP-diacylglycerol--glycerol-3-phosphate 3-phosphatidyltransferase n=1 Tax=Chromatocurvus halotolerans TaxID=1132028 RepID=A0A4R2KZ75_9GAMM|nr:CDP-alcohol phosphatidyltransferase family protein [Chromatocurvus halotolerans]TCO75588.1 CDP-diacylglycerol--glycerol-3-phosphate 3-phosphatidyltransferase [Chromatocurvus halotolerans]
MPGLSEALDDVPRVGVEPALQGELLRLAILGVSLLLVGATVLSGLEGAQLALRWLLVSLACWSFVLWQCRKRLHLNCSSPEEPDRPRRYATLGHGNRITLFRGLLISALAGFLLVAPADTSPWLLYVPALLYTAAALADLLDGRMARYQQHTTRLGAELDTALDAFGLLIAPLLAIAYGKLHVSYLLVSVAYYLFQCGIIWRKRHALPVYPLPPSRLRRYLAGVQMALVAVALWPPVPHGVTTGLGVVLMLPLLIGFCRDWWYVSGRRDVCRESCS